MGLFIGLALMGIGGAAVVIGSYSKDDVTMSLAITAGLLFLFVGFLVLEAPKASNTPAAIAAARQRNALATIAAATAAVADATAESELRALERAAATAAAAVKGGGDG